MRFPLAALLIALALLVAPSVAVAGDASGGGSAGEARGDVVEAFLATLPARFRADGVNPDGSTYSGTAQITFDPASLTARFDWIVGGNSYSGSGPLDQGRFVIDWGADTPAIYTVNPDLSLSGTWAGGTASEILTPLP